MGKKIMMFLIVSFMVFFAGTVWGFTESSNNNFFGTNAGISTTGLYNSFFGGYNGLDNTTGMRNSFFGFGAGDKNTTGSSNSFFGENSGGSNTIGGFNSYFGYLAGSSNVAGSYNVFLGNQAGYYETGSNKLYISNSNTSTPLIYGEFDNEYLEINGDLSVIGYVQLDLTTDFPPAADCDDPSEYGRMKVDEVNESLYICVVSGWKSMGQTRAAENDFNGDGISDVLVRNTDNGRWHMYLMDGTSNPTLVSRINMFESSAVSFQN